MPCTGKTLSLPNITCLDFKLDWDISGASPVVKITNNSTVVDPTKLKWWIFITSPSGTAIYGVDVNSGTPPTPDVDQVVWTAKTYVLQTPFGNPPCGQIEFSPNSPYTVTVFVQDTTAVATPMDSYSKTTIIVRPNGNTVNSCGNFGKAAVSMKVDCANKVIMCFDGTKLIYNNILTPLSTTQKWTLVYPADPAGDVPNMEALNVPNVNFPVGVNSKGYAVYFNETATYDYGNGITVTVQYKLYDKDGDLGLTFAVNCNTNLCLLQCQMKKFYELSKSRCGELENAQLTQKMVNLQWLFSQILTGIFQPLCRIDVAALIEEMKVIMGTDCEDCDCGCGDSDNFGFSNPTGGGGSPSSSCCPQIANVLDINTNLAPGACPGSFFPAAVYSPDGSTVIGMATSADSMISIINANAAWGVYGTAFNMGNCQVGFYLNPGINSVPPVNVSPATVINVIDQTTGVNPAACPGSYFPVTVYAPDGTTPIGTAGSITELITIVNSNLSWQAFGSAYYNNAFCTVAFIPADGVLPSTIPPIVVNSTTSCVGGIQHYTANVQDICGTPGPITSVSFPMNAWVDFGLGGGLEALGMISDNAAFIAALNAATGKPSSVTFSSGTLGGVLNYTVDNTDCAGYSGVVNIYSDTNAGAYMLYAANHRTVATPQPLSAGVYGVGIKTMSIIGQILGFVNDVFYWHVTRVQGNYLLITNSNAGQVFCFDITNPLMPSLFGSVVLPDTGSGNCFTGLPQQFGTNMYFGLYFPTDYHNMSLREVYVCESSTGSIWHVDFLASVPTVIKSFTEQRLVGQCPRVHYKGMLWFSTDGSYQAITGPGMPDGEVLRFSASAPIWDATAIAQVTIIPNFTEQVWAASFDPGTGYIYFSGQKGTIVIYDPGAGATVNSYALVMGRTATNRLNTKFWNNKLYHSSFGAYTAPGGLTTATRFIDTTTLGTTNTIVNFQSFLSNNQTHWNFMPLGNCNGVLTYEDGTNPGGFALFKLDGTFIGLIPYTGAGGSSYNVIPISGVGVYSPTTLIP